VKHLLALITRGAGYGAACFLLAMMLITVADVSSRALFNRPITGAYDLVQLFLVGTVFLSIPDVFMRGENIVIDFIDHLLGARAVALLKALANLLGFTFLAVLLWHMVPSALNSIRFHEVSPDLAIAMGVHWSLMIVGIFLALLPAALILLASLTSLLRPRDQQ
jgi:TRAP-type C4-dicarboxylate transport system permease small subunit